MTTIVDATGRPIAYISMPEALISLNTPINCFAVEDPPTDKMQYINGVWTEISVQPTAHHEYDYSKRLWHDLRKIDAIRSSAWESIKEQRDAFEFGGFSYEGNVYDSDVVSQARILAAAASGLPQSWTTADNSVIELTTEEIQALANSMQAHISEAHELGRIAREAINAAQTIEEIEAVTL